MRTHRIGESTIFLIQGHSKRTGMHAIDEYFLTEADLDAYQMHGNAKELPGMHRSAREHT